MSATSENAAKPKPRAKAAPKSAEGKVKKARVKAAVETFTCTFCKKTMKSELLMSKHLCEPKKRWYDRDLSYVRVAYGVYSLFWKINYRKEVPYDHFMKSSHYSLFVKFGKYMHDVNAIEPMDFAKFVIEKGAGLPIYDWPTDAVYETYVRQRTARESPDVAAERTILLMEQWAIESGENWIDFFRLVPAALAVHWIRSGRLSPWLLYATQSGNDLLNRLSKEQLDLVEQYISPDLWKRRIAMNRDAVMNLQAILKEAGL